MTLFRPVAPHASGEDDKGKVKSKVKSKVKMLRFMRDNPRITVRELSNLLGISMAGTEKNIRILKKEKRLRRVGSPRGGHWEVLHAAPGGEGDLE